MHPRSSLAIVATVFVVAAVSSLVLSSDASFAQDTLDLRGMWRQVEYLKADNQVRYQTDGYMMFSESHWMHVSYFNRDAREEDFSEAHHGTYRVTGSDTLDLDVSATGEGPPLP